MQTRAEGDTGGTISKGWAETYLDAYPYIFEFPLLNVSHDKAFYEDQGLRVLLGIEGYFDTFTESTTTTTTTTTTTSSATTTTEYDLELTETENTLLTYLLPIIFLIGGISLVLDLLGGSFSVRSFFMLSINIMIILYYALPLLHNL